MPSSSERQQPAVAPLNPGNLAKHTASLSDAADPGRTVRWYLCTVKHAARHYSAELADPNLLESGDGGGSGQAPAAEALNDVAGRLSPPPSRDDSAPLLETVPPALLVKREASVPITRQHARAAQPESPTAPVPRSREASTSTQQPGRRNLVGMMRSRRESEQMQLDKQAPASSNTPDAAEAAPVMEMEIDMTWRRKKGKKTDGRETETRGTREQEAPRDRAVRPGEPAGADSGKDKPARKPASAREERFKTRDEVEREELLAQRRERRREKAEIRNVAVKDRTKVTSASFKATAAQRETAQSQRRENDRDRSKKRKRERTGRERRIEAGSFSSNHDSGDVRRQHKADRTDKDEVVASGVREGDSNDSESYSDSAVEDYRIYEPPKKRRVDSVQRSIRLVAEGVTKSSKHPLARARHIAPQGRVTLKSGIYNQGAASTKTHVPSSQSKKIVPLPDLAFNETVFLKMQRKEKRDRSKPDITLQTDSYRQAQTIRSPGRPRVTDSAIAHRKSTKQAITQRAPSPELADQPSSYRKQRAADDTGQEPVPVRESREKSHFRLETKEAERSSSPAPILPVLPRLLPRSNDAAERVAEEARASSESQFEDGLSDASLERRRIEARKSVPDEQASDVSAGQLHLQQHQVNPQLPEELDFVDHGPLTKAGQAFLIPVRPGAGRSVDPPQRRDANKLTASAVQTVAPGRHSARRTPGLPEPQLQSVQGPRSLRSFETGLEDFGFSAPVAAEYATSDDVYGLPAFKDVTNSQRRYTTVDDMRQYANQDRNFEHSEGHDVKRDSSLQIHTQTQNRDLASPEEVGPFQHASYLYCPQTYAGNEQIYDNHYKYQTRDSSLEYYYQSAEAALGANEPEVDQQQRDSLEKWYADLSDGWIDGDSYYDGSNEQDSLFNAAEQHAAPEAGSSETRQYTSLYDGDNFSMLADPEGRDLVFADQYQPAEPELEFERSQGEKLGLNIQRDYEGSDRLQGELASHWRPQVL